MNEETAKKLLQFLQMQDYDILVTNDDDDYNYDDYSSRWSEVDDDQLVALLMNFEI